MQNLNEGTKYDSDKLRMDLVPVSSMKAMARGFGYGAAKYEAWNWAKGISYSRIYAALQRHLTAWWAGEDVDSESGLCHLDHAFCCLAMLEGTARLHPNLDDRFKEGRSENK